MADYSEAEIERSQRRIAAVLGIDNDLADPSVGIGHNQPSQADLHRDRVDALVDTANRWAAERPLITDAETAAKCTDFLNQLAAETKKLDEARKVEKAPHLAAAKAVDDAWHPLLDAVEACKRLLRPLHTAWLKREQARLDAERRKAQEAAAKAQREAEEAARKAAEPKSVRDIISASEAERRASEAAEAALAVPARAQARGALGGRAHSLRTTWRAHVVDLVAAVRHYRDRAEVRELIERLANADARAGVRSIPGCAVYSTEE